MVALTFDARTDAQKEDIPQIPESEVCAYIEGELSRLGDRVVWYKQVGMTCWTHSLKASSNRLRIDYVAAIDGGDPLGIEVKANLPHPADLGRALLQCAQYAHGVIAAATSDRIMPQWVGRPLKAVFLWADNDLMPSRVVDHKMMAHRLFGPANVGFASADDDGLKLDLCAERFWSEDRGYHGGAIVTGKVFRSGNGSFNPAMQVGR